MMSISRHMVELGWVEMFFRGISAGFLIAAMVWLLPSAEGAQFHMITLMTYLIAVGGFTHIVAGSVEAFLLVINGEASPVSMLAGFMVPTLLGNIVGGTVLFAVISYAQGMEEI
jgi:formate-nitrite transporter family protein